jgi:hypothetical protein
LLLLFACLCNAVLLLLLLLVKELGLVHGVELAGGRRRPRSELLLLELSVSRGAQRAQQALIPAPPSTHSSTHSLTTAAAVVVVVVVVVVVSISMQHVSECGVGQVVEGGGEVSLARAEGQRLHLRGATVVMSV